MAAAAAAARSSDGRTGGQHSIGSTYRASRQKPRASDGAAGAVGNTFGVNIAVVGNTAWFVTAGDKGIWVAPDALPSAWGVKHTCHRVFTASRGGTAPNTRTRAALIIGLDEELDRRSLVAGPTVYSYRRTGAARNFDFATAATARNAAAQGSRVISATA